MLGQQPYQSGSIYGPISQQPHQSYGPRRTQHSYLMRHASMIESSQASLRRRRAQAEFYEQELELERMKTSMFGNHESYSYMY